MAYLNKVFLIGNLTRDPELRVTPKGTAICQFGLAVNRQFKDESGATRDETTFVDIEAWGKQGQKRSKMKVVLENVQFLSTRGAGTAGGSGASAVGASSSDDIDQTSPERNSPPARGATTKAPAPGNIDEDVPF